MGQLFKIFIIALGLYYFFRLIGKAIKGNDKKGPFDSSGNQGGSSQRGNDDNDDEYVDYEEID
jgi:hypothetical protein